MSETPESAALEALLAGRYSCRQFKPDPVPGDVIDRILALAQRTASWCNAQPWHVVITRGEATEALRSALSQQGLTRSAAPPDFAFPPRYEGVYDVRRREAGRQLHESIGIAPRDRAASARQGLENFRFFGAPHVAVLHVPDSLGPYALVDCGGYITIFMLAARALGIASIAQAALAMHGTLLHRLLGIPDDRRIVCGISFGYGDEHAPVNRFRTSRAAVADIATVVSQLPLLAV